jgi:hypothetical protein
LRGPQSALSSVPMTDSTPTASGHASPPAHVSAGQMRHFRYYDLVMAAFVAILLLSNIIGASKLSTVGQVTFGAGILFFPLSYVIGDVLTEVYGYARAPICFRSRRPPKGPARSVRRPMKASSAARGASSSRRSPLSGRASSSTAMFWRG